MYKSLVFYFTILICCEVSAQARTAFFTELTYAGIGYSSLAPETKKPWNSGFGIAANCSLNKSISVELANHNAWINETILNTNYRFIAHWTAFHLGFGRDYEKWSLHFLVGPSFGSKRLGLELGSRFTRQLNTHLAIHTSLFLSNFGDAGLNVTSGGNYFDPLSAFIFFNANLGLAWHFTTPEI